MQAIERPPPSSGALFVKLSGLSIASGSEVRVAEGDAAVFVRDGVVAGMLGPGAFRVDPASAPFFGILAGSSADVVFVRTVEHGWWAMSADPYPLRDGRTGASAQVRFTGSFSVQVMDPRAFATSMVVREEGWLWAYVESVVDRACRDAATAMMKEGYGLADLTQYQGAQLLAQRTVADAAGDLAAQPLRIVRFGSLVVDVL